MIFSERFPKVPPYVLGSAANVKEVLGSCPLPWVGPTRGPVPQESLLKL